MNAKEIYPAYEVFAQDDGAYEISEELFARWVIADREYKAVLEELDAVQEAPQ